MTKLQFTRLEAKQIFDQKDSKMGEMIFHELFYATEDYNLNRTLEDRFTLIKYKKGAILCNINNKIVAVLSTNCDSFNDFIKITIKSAKRLHNFKFYRPNEIERYLCYIDDFKSNLTTN